MVAPPLAPARHREGVAAPSPASGAEELGASYRSRTCRSFCVREGVYRWHKDAELGGYDEI